MLDTFGYDVEPTGADCPSQNGGAEIYNKTLAVKHELYYMVLGSPHNSGLVPASTPYTSTIVSSTLLQTRLPMKVGMVVSLT
jgi:hypothetical protein